MNKHSVEATIAVYDVLTNRGLIYEGPALDTADEILDVASPVIRKERDDEILEIIDGPDFPATKADKAYLRMLIELDAKTS